MADHSVFHPEYVITGPGERPLQGLEHSLYEGQVVGEPGSHVFGTVRDGVFDGTIKTRHRGTFYVERVQRYLSDKPANSSAHSVIYHHDHLKMPFDKSWQIGAASPGCGASPDIQTWMSNIQISNTESNSDELSPEAPVDNQKEEEKILLDPSEDPNPKYKYSEQANDRKKRSTKPAPSRKSCSLFIQTDPLLWKHVREQEPSDSKTQEEILSIVAQHVKAVNRIYGDTEFNAGHTRHTGYTFQVNRIKILNDSDCQSTPKKSFCERNMDASYFLEKHSEEDHSDFCLAYVLTYRDFPGGTLGLAWPAYPSSGKKGGICDKYTDKKSFNTGIITFVNYNARVPPKVSQLTLAHEIGHNFGSLHDPASCRPGGSRGNYIMFASATSGDRDNNNKFSPCSVKNISAVLDAVADNKKYNCFQESDGAFCGNKIVEDGEECDCGFDETECAEQCCHPRTTDNNKQKNPLSCKLKTSRSTGQKVECSPSIGPCCDGNNTCRFTRWAKECKADQECTKKAYCDGASARCPAPQTKGGVKKYFKKEWNLLKH